MYDSNQLEHVCKLYREGIYDNKHHMKKNVFIIALVALLFSCATRTKIEYRDRDVNHYITNTIHDTLIDRSTDSVFVSVYTKGDTVYSEKYKEKIRYRDRIIETHDTCWRDSVVTEYTEKTKEIVKYPRTFWLLLGISVISIIIALIKLIKWLQIR